jgi:hypothetical protein
VTEHEPLFRVQLVADKLPAGFPVWFGIQVALQLTVPVGFVEVPGDVSNTVTVQLLLELTRAGLGLQLMLSRVDRLLMDSARVPELGR